MLLYILGMPTQAEDAAAAAEIEQNYETMSMLKDDRIKRLVLVLRWQCETHRVQVGIE